SISGRFFIKSQSLILLKLYPSCRRVRSYFSSNSLLLIPGLLINSSKSLLLRTSSCILSPPPFNYYCSTDNPIVVHVFITICRFLIVHHCVLQYRDINIFRRYSYVCCISSISYWFLFTVIVDFILVLY